jgi:hypothetical protein
VLDADYFAIVRPILRLRRDQVVQYGAEVPGATPDVENFSTRTQEREEIIDRKGVLDWSVKSYPTSDRDCMQTMWGADIVAPWPIDLCLH